MKKFDSRIFMAAIYRETGEKVAAPVNFHQACALLPMAGEQFLREAYSTLLGREPDPAGMDAYTPRVQSLPGRFLVLAALYFSPERIWLPGWKRTPLKICGHALRLLRRS